MFFGTLPQVVSQYLYNELERHKPQRVFSLFSGNFVFEQIAKTHNKNIELFSTDVSLYSRAIGLGATNQSSDIVLNEKLLQDFPIFEGKTSPFDIAVQVIFFSDVAITIKKKEKVIYYNNMYRDAVSNQKKYVEKISDKLHFCYFFITNAVRIGLIRRISRLPKYCFSVL